MSRLKNAYSTCMECGGTKMKKGGWIKNAIKNPGSFTKQAQSAGMSVSAFRNKVLANKGDYSSTTVKRANLAKTLSRMRKGDDGMEVEETITPLDPKNIEGNKMATELLNKENEKQKVIKYQEMLNKKYGANLAVDGAWGKNTQAAYERFIKNGNKTSKPSSSKKIVESDGTESNPVRMSPVNIKVKARQKSEPIRVMPNTPAPYKRPNLQEYLSRPSFQFPTGVNKGPVITAKGNSKAYQDFLSRTSPRFMGGGSIPGVNGSVIGSTVPMSKTGQSFPKRNAGTSKLAKFKKK